MNLQDPILLISYAFPPVGGIMVQRVLSFAKYLPRCGCKVHVLTTWNPATPVFDPGLVDQVPPEVSVHRAFTPEPPFYLRKRLWERFDRGSKEAAVAPAGGWKAGLRRRLKRALCPDVQVLWTPFARRRAERLIRRHAIGYVLVTVPPFSLLQVGNALKRRFPHIRLIADFRDEWLRFMLTDFAFMADPEFQVRAAQIERETVELADLVIAVTRTSLAEMRSRYPGQPAEKFVFLPNGYDPEAFQDFEPRPRADGKVVVTHLGTAYKTSSPVYYLEALRASPDEVRSAIETRFIGRIAETEQPLMEEYRDLVRLLGFLPQKEALAATRETDYLLLTMTNDFSLPGKLFEYLATGKPVLALSPPGGEVDRILQETGAGWCVDHRDPAAIRQMLAQAVEAVRQRRFPLERKPDLVRRYQRPRLAAELAGLLRERWGSPPPSGE